jgi:hypothetical protein
MSRAAMLRAYRAFDEAGLRPCLDFPLERVLADCPACQSGDYLYRPLVLAFYGGTRMLCSSGCSDAAVRKALAEGPAIDWEALAHELLDIAQGLREALQVAQAKHSPQPLRLAA